MAAAPVLILKGRLRAQGGHNPRNLEKFHSSSPFTWTMPGRLSRSSKNARARPMLLGKNWLAPVMVKRRLDGFVVLKDRVDLVLVLAHQLGR